MIQSRRKANEVFLKTKRLRAKETMSNTTEDHEAKLVMHCPAQRNVIVASGDFPEVKSQYTAMTVVDDVETLARLKAEYGRGPYVMELHNRNRKGVMRLHSAQRIGVALPEWLARAMG